MVWAAQHRLQEGRYRIESVLGRGGFGLTYLAWDNRRADWVVIKTLNDDVQSDPGFEKFQQDFLNEALRLARCRHPHIVRVDEVILEAGLWCIVMEYVPGLTLQKCVAKQGKMSEREALHHIRQVGSALSALHDQDMLHRDVKPANIILRDHPLPPKAVLIDFGLVRDFSQGMIQHHTSYGTDGYAPIEQYDSLRRRGAWIDVYGLAATLYTALTGEIPLCAPARIGGRDLDPPQQINPCVSNDTQAAILAGMALYAEDRPASIADWIQLLPPSETDLEDPDRTVLDGDGSDPDPGLFAPAAQSMPSGGSPRPILSAPEVLPDLGISTSDLSELEQALKAQAPPQPDSLPLNRRKTDPPDPTEILAPPSGSCPRSNASGAAAKSVVTERDSESPSQFPQPAIPESGQEPGKFQTSTGPNSVSVPKNGSISPTCVQELTQLRDLLRAQQWQQADALTTELMLQIADRTREGHFDIDAIKKFPKAELQLIDKLWMAYSEAHFGFGIQFHLWSQAPRDIEAWGRLVGWRRVDRWIQYHELTYGLEAPAGHLPVGFLAGQAGGLRSSLLLFDRYLLAKWSVCLNIYTPPPSSGR